MGGSHDSHALYVLDDVIENVMIASIPHLASNLCGAFGMIQDVIGGFPIVYAKAGKV
jgi:hypothetical protein